RNSSSWSTRRTPSHCHAGPTCPSSPRADGTGPAHLDPTPLYHPSGRLLTHEREREREKRSTRPRRRSANQTLVVVSDPAVAAAAMPFTPGPYSGKSTLALVARVSAVGIGVVYGSVKLGILKR
uniref:ATP synthase subunit e, mitochondrial n=1 Tax=Aegilops tauschii subsp. strangulata TaxID=200361 RepID=A0A453A7K8_AEGTS